MLKQNDFDAKNYMPHLMIIQRLVNKDNSVCVRKQSLLSLKRYMKWIPRKHGRKPRSCGIRDELGRQPQGDH